ncbi:rhodanese-like domain-containing protein [Mariniflexile sp.]|uniref:rhodanese-like domain-containing protein n=1 Tax=Mariniflexile sp. TaxID=1979402 RepID=UPI0035630FBD
MKHLFLLILVLISVFGTSCKETGAQNQVSHVSPNEAYQVMKDTLVQIIDLRTPAEFEEGYLKNAINIDVMASSFSKEIKQVDSLKPILIYCRSGNRSEQSLAVFLKAGFTKIYHLEAGILGWEAAQLPILRD